MRRMMLDCDLVYDYRRLTDPQRRELRDLLWRRQGKRCACCGKPVDHAAACLDHSHANYRTRAVVCRRCNVVIGFMEKTPELRRAVKRYVTRSAWRHYGIGGNIVPCANAGARLRTARE